MKSKPRAFIGSSVEGLSIAYAVQQNLRHNAEVTVWDQGIFELSSTTMESLAKALESNDFGIFVFSPDDVTKMRGKSHSAVRDNVLFEMGLFLGKLGRGRVFFLIPDSGTLRLPSDLLGITPATFETGRTDGSMQAATGAACHQMRTQIERLGRMCAEDEEDNLPDEAKEQAEESREWFHDFIDKKYKEAQTKLEEKLKSESGDDALKTKSWAILCEMRQDEQRGIDLITEFANENKKSAVAQEYAAMLLRTEKYTNNALELLRNADPSILNSPTLAIEMANCLVSLEEHQEAIDLLIARDFETEPSVSLALAGILEGQGNAKKAIEIVHRSHIKNPKNKQLRYKYARLAQELDQYLIALYLLDGLAHDELKNIEYWGYLGELLLIP